jgi:hypothetical protein
MSLLIETINTDNEPNIIEQIIDNLIKKNQEIMKVTEKQLKEKETICFENQDHSGHIQFNKKNNHFGIFFNGICIQSSKTFMPSKKKLTILFEKHNLQFTEN